MCEGGYVSGVCCVWMCGCVGGCVWVECGVDDGVDVRVRDVGERGRGVRVRVVGWICC